MRTIGVVNLKGGSGKSTIAVQLALHWSDAFKTAVADIDPQGSSMLVLDRSPVGLQAIASTAAKLPTLKTVLAREDIARLVVDTPGSIKADVAAAISAPDLALMVVRPSYLDLAAAAATSQLVRQLHTRALVVLNQAPPMRGSHDSPLVGRALEALGLLGLPIARTVLRSRVAYGRATELGRPIAAYDPGSAAAEEFGQLATEIDLALAAVGR